AREDGAGEREEPGAGKAGGEGVDGGESELRIAPRLEEAMPRDDPLDRGERIAEATEHQAAADQRPAGEMALPESQARGNDAVEQPPRRLEAVRIHLERRHELADLRQRQGVAGAAIDPGFGILSELDRGGPGPRRRLAPAPARGRRRLRAARRADPEGTLSAERRERLSERQLVRFGTLGRRPPRRLVEQRSGQLRGPAPADPAAGEQVAQDLAAHSAGEIAPHERGEDVRTRMKTCRARLFAGHTVSFRTVR